MPVLKTLKKGIDQSSFDHTNPMVQTIENERQPAKYIQYSSKGITIRDEWLGTSEEINALLTTFVPDPYTYDFAEGESYQVERQRGDLSKLTKVYVDNWDSSMGASSPSDPIDESVGITPWSIASETTDIGAIDYYILKHQLTEDQQKLIKRDRLALWEMSPYEYKEQFKYNTVLNGWLTVDCDPNGNEDSPITLEVAQWIVEQGRSHFPLTTARITYEELTDGAAATEKKALSAITRPVIKKSLKEDVNKSVEVGGPLEFPSNEFGKELSAIPNCPFKFNFAYPTMFMMTDWNITLHDATGKYLVTKEYVSYPEAFPLPLDPTPGDPSTDKK